jgi:hypothetical protein
MYRDGDYGFAERTFDSFTDYLGISSDRNDVEVLSNFDKDVSNFKDYVVKEAYKDRTAQTSIRDANGHNLTAN